MALAASVLGEGHDEIQDPWLFMESADWLLPVIRSCPICGKESGVTHGDQLWVTVVCEDCREMGNDD